MENLADAPRMILARTADQSIVPWRRMAALDVAFLVALVGFTSWLGYVGFIASDDGSYSEAAIGWLDHFPYVGINHWGLRHTVVLPVALSFWLGGINELTMMLPTKVYLLLLILLTYGCLSRLVERRTALLASALLALTPIVILPSSPSDDLVECFFVVASFWAFYFGSGARTSPALLLLSGICAGLAFVTRETSAIIALFYGILFLVGLRLPRAYFFLIAGGFLAVLAIDTVYLASVTGDPLYRFHISIGAVTSDNPLDPKSAAALPVQDGLDFAGLIAAPRLIQPILMLFTAHTFGPIFFLVIPAGLWLWKNRGLRETQFEIARLWGFLGLIWFLTLSYVLIVLYVDPRYFSVTVYCALLIVALWLRTPSLKRISFGLISLLSVGDLLMIYLDNKNLIFGEKTLVAVARASDEPVYTDPATLNGAKFLLKHTAAGHEVLAGLARPGSLFFYNSSPTRLEFYRDSVGRFEPRATWTLLRSFDEEPKLSARILRASGLEFVLPAGVAQKLDPPLHHCSLYRLPPSE
jgi:4-amino-4-deoxy-L-arabinose transferase-like glycosyltransferase